MLLTFASCRKAEYSLAGINDCSGGKGFVFECEINEYGYYFREVFGFFFSFLYFQAFYVFVFAFTLFPFGLGYLLLLFTISFLHLCRWCLSGNLTLVSPKSFFFSCPKLHIFFYYSFHRPAAVQVACQIFMLFIVSARYPVDSAIYQKRKGKKKLAQFTDYKAPISMNNQKVRDS